jgi:hypothetical protein
MFFVGVQINVKCFLCFRFEFWKDGTRGKNAQPLRQKAAQVQKTRVCSVCLTLKKSLMHTTYVAVFYSATLTPFMIYQGKVPGLDMRTKVS